MTVQKTWMMAARMALLLAPGMIYAQKQCDQLQPLPGSFEYKERGNRCEGLYVANVGNKTLDLIGLTRGIIQYSLQSGVVLHVSTAPQSVPVHIRAVAIPPRTYYRMDATMGGNSVLDWPVRDVLAPQDLTPDRIGVLAWKGDFEPRLFLPVKVDAGDSHLAASDTYLVIRPSFDLEVIKWRSGPIVSGDCSAFGAWKDASHNQILAGQPVRIPLTGLTGQQCVQVVAQSGSANDWSEPLSIRVELGQR
jgi:hypothetical protein